MNTKSTLAALGPAALLAAVSLVIDTSRIPSWALIFTTALLSSLLTITVLNFKPKAASSKPARSNAVAGSSNSGSSSGGKKETGSVKWFNASKGFGFITRTNGDEIFVHFRSIVGQRSLRDGQQVEFVVTNGSKGLQAEDVVPLK